MNFSVPTDSSPLTIIVLSFCGNYSNTDGRDEHKLPAVFGHTS
jgi:hypothetical protein